MESSNQVARTAPSLRELALELGATVKQFHLPWAGPLGPGRFVLATVDSLVFSIRSLPRLSDVKTSLSGGIVSPVAVRCSVTCQTSAVISFCSISKVPADPRRFKLFW